MKKEIFKIHCPSCGQINSSVIETQEAVVDYKYDFELNKYDHVATRDAHSAEYYCSSCREPFDSELDGKINAAING